MKHSHAVGRSKTEVVPSRTVFPRNKCKGPLDDERSELELKALVSLYVCEPEARSNISTTVVENRERENGNESCSVR